MPLEDLPKFPSDGDALRWPIQEILGSNNNAGLCLTSFSLLTTLLFVASPCRSAYSPTALQLLQVRVACRITSLITSRTNQRRRIPPTRNTKGCLESIASRLDTVAALRRAGVGMQ